MQSRSFFEDWDEIEWATPSVNSSPSRFWQKASKTAASSPFSPADVARTSLSLRHQTPFSQPSSALQLWTSSNRKLSLERAQDSDSRESVQEVLMQSDEEIKKSERVSRRLGNTGTTEYFKKDKMQIDEHTGSSSPLQPLRPPISIVKDPNHVSRRGNVSGRSYTLETDIVRPAGHNFEGNTSQSSLLSDADESDGGNLAATRIYTSQHRDKVSLAFDPGRRPRAPFPSPGNVERNVHTPVSSDEALTGMNGGDLPPCPDRMRGIKELTRSKAQGMPQSDAKPPSRPRRPTQSNIFADKTNAVENTSKSDIQPDSASIRTSKKRVIARRLPPKQPPPSAAMPILPRVSPDSVEGLSVNLYATPSSPASSAATNSVLTESTGSLCESGAASSTSVLDFDSTSVVNAKKSEAIEDKSGQYDKRGFACKTLDNLKGVETSPKPFKAILLSVQKDTDHFLDSTEPIKVILSIGGLEFVSTLPLLCQEGHGTGLSLWLSEMVDSHSGEAGRKETQESSQTLILNQHSQHSDNNKPITIFDQSTTSMNSISSDVTARKNLSSNPLLAPLQYEKHNASEPSLTPASDDGEADEDPTFDEAFGAAIIRDGLISQRRVSSGDEPPTNRQMARHSHRRSLSAPAMDLRENVDSWVSSSPSSLPLKRDFDSPMFELVATRQPASQIPQVPHSVRSLSQSNFGSMSGSEQGDCDSIFSSNEVASSVHGPCQDTSVDECTPTALMTSFSAPQITSMHVLLERRNPLWYPIILHALQHNELPDFMRLICQDTETADMSPDEVTATARAVKSEAEWLGYENVAVMCIELGAQ
jgi:hypothetical protein